MKVETVIKNGKIVTPDGIYSAAIAINDGKIVSISSDANAPSSDETIDVRGKLILPGVVDPHVHYQTAYYKSQELVRSETRAAAAGGVTTVGAFWFEREDPDASYLKVFPRGIETVQKNSVTDMVLHGDIFTEAQANEIPKAASQCGVTSYKIFMSYKGEESKLFGVRGLDDGLIVHSMSKLASVGDPALVMMHCENVEITDRERERVKRKGGKDLNDWNDARPWYAEEENLRRAIFFSQVTGARTYIVHHSGCRKGSGVDVIAKAKAEGARILAETLPYFLTFSKDDTQKIGVMGKNIPPFRDRESVERLWTGLADGTIDCVASDTSTIMPREKRLGDGDLWSSIPGYPGSEVLLPVMLSEGYNKGRISLPKLVQVCSYNASRCLGIFPRKGTIQVGSDADLVIVDPKKQVKVTVDKLHSAADYSAYEGWTLTGWPIRTILRGETIMQDGEVTGKPGRGRYLKRNLAKADKVRRET